MPTTTTIAPKQPAAKSHNGPHAVSVGVILSERIYAGLIIDGRVSGELLRFPDSKSPANSDDDDSLVELPTEPLVEAICELILRAAAGRESELGGVGIALPGLLANGIVQEAPNLPQLKGARVESLLSAGLTARGVHAAVHIVNDADAMAAGLACAHGKLDHIIRVWTLGTGIGYGRYPFHEGVWEGGHTTVTLDDKENFCGCGGKGHLEGIMGHRAMRLRFLDMEPEEVFEAANRKSHPDPRCLEFKHLWHRALAAATASSIHMSGTGKFFITGYNVRFLDMNMLRQYLKSMVKMSSLQAYSLEVVEDDHALRILGAAVAAQQMSHS